MYKVFMDKLTVEFVEKSVAVTCRNECVDSELFLRDLSKWLRSDGTWNTVNVLCPNLMEDWQSFQSNFSLIRAAGGVVEHDGNVLFIKRNECWDLPKGWMEDGETPEETAKREILEECGDLDLHFLRFLTDTYHTYFQNGKPILKHTHWFSFVTSQVRQLIPQEKEGITDVKFFEQNELKIPLGNTYPSIQEVVNTYLEG
jgi:ADP-ribose pyrophosphatase YjhB (NUDIX family)